MFKKALKNIGKKLTSKSISKPTIHATGNEAILAHGHTEKIIRDYIVSTSGTKDSFDVSRSSFLDNPVEHISMMEAFAKILNDKSPKRRSMLAEAMEDKSSGLTILADSRLYYKTYEALYRDWDLKDTRAVEDVYLYFRKSEKDSYAPELSAEEMERKERNAEKFKVLRKHYMVIGTGRREWNKGKKMIGILYPTPAPSTFFYDELVFIGPDVAQKQYGSQDRLDIFDKERNIVYTSRLYAYIATQNFSDLIIYQYDSALWSVWAVKDGQNICIGKDVFTNNEAQALIQALLQDMEENTNNQDFNVTGTVHKNSFDKLGLGEDADIPIGDKTFRIDMSRQYKSSISRGSQRFARTINIRMLETGSALRKVDEIGYFPEDLDVIHAALRQNRHINTGCVIYAGAPSSGKSTSLFSLFADLHENYGAQVVTVDSAVEFEHHGFRQISLDDTKRAAEEDRRMSIEKVTNNMLKQYANAMMVGEVRDADQISAFVKAAERGRLTAGTMHTNDTRSIFTVLENAGLKPYQYLPSLRLLVHHTLVPKICPKCNGTGEIHEEGIKDTSCAECYGTGAKGREVIYEIAFLVPGKVPLDANPAKDFDELIKSGAIIFRSKEEIAKRKFDLGLIDEDVYRSFRGEHIERIKSLIDSTREEEYATAQ